jgi:tetratricopeptide (TPR) repeat protein
MKSLVIMLMVVCFALTAPFALAVGGGAVDGGGGGGNMVPELGRGGPSLTEDFKKGVALLAEGECKRAATKFLKILKKVPRNAETNYLYGLALQCQKKHKQAIRFFQRAKRDDQQFFRAYTEMGLSYLILGRPDLARIQMTALDKMKLTCRDRCPSKLLKSVAKLRKAIDRIEGKSGETNP